VPDTLRSVARALSGPILGTGICIVRRGWYWCQVRARSSKARASGPVSVSGCSLASTAASARHADEGDVERPAARHLDEAMRRDQILPGSSLAGRAVNDAGAASDSLGETIASSGDW